MTSLMLKIVLVVSMTIDHIAVVYLPYGSNWYTWLRMFGRPAMPIACFLLVQGFLKTSSRRKYTVRMLITAVIAEIFWIFLWLRQTMSADAAVKAADEAAGVEEVAIRYGALIQAIINFLIVALCIFIVVRGINRLKDKTAKEEEEDPYKIDFD